MILFLHQLSFSGCGVLDTDVEGRRAKADEVLARGMDKPLLMTDNKDRNVPGISTAYKQSEGPLSSPKHRPYW